MGATEPQTQVSDADLRDAITAIQDAAQRLRTVQQKLDTAGVELKHNWVGQSEMAFDRVHQTWHLRMDRVLGSLQRLAENIGVSNKNYKEFNEEREAAANQINNLINQQFNSRLS
ncbi:WXG100 family type VII secretion target [Nonomuraea sp. H19]|uniref:WXG100 family type VII secretion target n=1 Tax=Nonomuraea sp. H19 TaxID=3452206 RepID=UPI003F891513